MGGPIYTRDLLATVLTAVLICAADFTGAPGGGLARGPAHPLDPLTKEELSAAVAVLRAEGKVSDASRFPVLTLNELPKVEVLEYRPGGSVRREAFAVVYERVNNQTFEAVVDVRNRRVLSWKPVVGAQPALMAEDAVLTTQIVRGDVRWQQAMRKRGIEDFQSVQIDPWPAGFFSIPGEEGVRMVRAVSYYRGNAKNAYARPIEGVVAYVDLNAKRVVQLVDAGVVPVPRATADFDAASVGRLRPAPKPLQIVQPGGVTFEVQGNEIRWQNWRFRFTVHPREGLVLYTVGYEDGGRLRSILYRASLSEMVVPYGDPGPAWFFRSVFDEGEIGLGRLADALEPRADVPENAVLFDAIFANDLGSPYDHPRAVALYERDGGILWKHFDWTSRRNETRRARQLVLTTVSTIGNYEYGFNWVFHQDGALELEALLTGVMQPKAVPDEVEPGHAGERYGHMIARGIAAVHHQHFFNFRLDLDVDGAAGNSVVELNTEAVPPGPENPYGNAFTMKETLLRTEQEARRRLDLASSRKWKVINSSVRNAMGQPTSYLLIPGENAVPYAAPTSSVRRRGGFLDAHVWVTPYDPAQTHAAGDYINQAKGGEGLPRWAQAKRSIEDRDIVLWYTMGTTHIARPEEWPVMPVHRLGFKLIPGGFFGRNPALDVPKPEP